MTLQTLGLAGNCLGPPKVNMNRYLLFFFFCRHQGKGTVCGEFNEVSQSFAMSKQKHVFLQFAPSFKLLFLGDLSVTVHCIIYCNRGRKIFEPPRYMSVNEAVSQLMEVVKNRDLKGEPPGKVAGCYPKGR